MLLGLLALCCPLVCCAVDCVLFGYQGQCMDMCCLLCSLANGFVLPLILKGSIYSADTTSKLSHLSISKAVPCPSTMASTEVSSCRVEARVVGA